MFRRIKNLLLERFGGLDYYRINYIIYSTAGAWTLQKKYMGSSKWVMKIYVVTQIIISLECVVSLFALSYDAYLLRHDIERLNYSLSSTVLFVASIFRICFLIAKKDELEDCLQTLNNNFYLDTVGKTESDLEILQKGEDNLKKISKLFYFLMNFGLLARIICQLAENLMILPYPFKPLETPYFEIMFVLQTFGLSHFILVVISHEMVIYGFFIRIGNHLEIVTKNLSNISELYGPEYFGIENDVDVGNVKYDVIISKKNSAETIERRLMIESMYRRNESVTESFIKWQKRETHKLIKQVVIHHQNILRITRRLNNLFSESFLIQILGGGFLLVLLFVDVIWKSKKLSLKIWAQSVYAGATLLDITIFCYYGSKMETKSQEAVNSLYGSPWLEMDTETRNIISYFLMSLWQYPRLKAGRVWAINLNFYVKFVHMIYNSMAFLQNTAKRYE